MGLNLSDPNGLLKGQGGEGFTVALLERDHEGLRMGPRHMPLNAAFMNGTVEGEEVWIPMSSILGGQERCGFGWNMFVECLAEGRGVSLPAGSVGAARTVTCGVGAYSRVRKQFRVPIAEFGGIQEGKFGSSTCSPQRQRVFRSLSQELTHVICYFPSFPLDSHGAFRQ